MNRLFGLAFIAVPALALARPAAHTQAPASLEVTGQAAVWTAPDRAFIDVGVTTEASDPPTAAQRNAVRVSRVTAALRRAAGPGAVLKTINYSIQPQYRYHAHGQSRTLTGYAVRNWVQVQLDTLARIGRVIGAASTAGANLQQDLRFSLRHPEAVQLRALAQAAAHAHAAAETLAAALGLRIVRIISVRQVRVGASSPRPRIYRMGIRAAPGAAPIQPGLIRVTARVILTVAVAHKSE